MTLIRSCLFAGVALRVASIAAAQGSPPKNVVLLDASREHVTCVVPAMITPPAGPHCDDTFRALDWSHAAELHVINRKFLTDYSVQVDGTTTPAAAPIRGVEEVANLTLSSPLVGAIVTKGGVTVSGITPFQPRTTPDFLAQLIDETQADQPAVAIRADAAELAREVQAMDLAVLALDAQYAAVTGDPLSPSPVACDVVGGVPVLQWVAACLDRLATDVAPAVPPVGFFADEMGFVQLNRRAHDLIDVVSSLQRRLSQAALPASSTSIGDALAQLEKNAATLSANVAAFRQAIALRNTLAGTEATKMLRTEQLRVALRKEFKPATGDPALDETELNSLIAKYLNVVSTKDPVSPSTVDEATRSGAEARVHLEEAASLRARWLRAAALVQRRVPALVDSVNAAQSRVVTGLDALYDRSAVPTLLVKQIDLSTHAGENLMVFFSVVRTEAFARLSMAPQSAVVAAASGAAASAATPDESAPAVAAIATSATSMSGAAASAAVAHGTFEVHHYDHGTITAGFAATTLTQVHYGVVNGTVSRWQDHPVNVLLGIDYYFRSRDTYPGAPNAPLATLGLFGGVSLSAADNYFTGVAWEPALGLNVIGGVHIGHQSVLQAPALNAAVANDAAFVTRSVWKAGFFLSAGLDIGLFRRVFGKVVGIGTTTG